MTKLLNRGRIRVQGTLAAVAAVAALAAGLMGCGSSAVPATESSAIRVAVDRSSVNVLCTGSASTKPTIVLVAGEEDPLTRFSSLQAALSRTNRVCSYDRPGEGASAKPTGSQTLSDSASLLDDLLDTEKVRGKVVVVGHSLGGLIAAQFAHQYPTRVAAVVLLDATAPSVGGAIESLIPATATGVPAQVREEVGGFTSAAKNREGLVYNGQPIGSLGAIPLTVVQHGQPIYRDVPQYGNQLQAIWTKGQQQWASLSSNSKLITATKSGHYIYLDQQALTVQLIEHAPRVSGLSAPSLLGASHS